MKKAKTNILVLGLLSTGSSALVDMLKEYDDIHSVPFEFNDFRAPGLVADQLRNPQESGFPNEIGKLTSLKSRIKLVYGIFPILRLKLDTITGIRNRFKHNSLRIKQLNILKKLNAKLVSQISVKEKIIYANHWIQEIGSLNNRNKNLVLFEQALLTGIEINNWKKVFHPFKLIIVYRDPKDQLAEIIKNEKLLALYGAPNVNYGGVALETIFGRSHAAALQIHIQAIKNRQNWIGTLFEEIDTDNFLLIDFEGLVKNYETYKTIIENFLNINPQNNSKSKYYFDPKNAIEKIGIYDKYLTKSELESFSELEIWYTEMTKRCEVLYNRFLKITA
jgi:hypothetical protein